MQSREIQVVFDGGSKGNPGLGYGSYATTIDGETEVTRLEFGDGVTNNEAEYDTLIAALEMLIANYNAGEINLEARGDSQLVIYQVLGKWKAKDSRMRERRDRARGLLSQFGRYRLILQPREDSVRVLGH